VIRDGLCLIVHDFAISKAIESVTFPVLTKVSGQFAPCA